jgi:hypothetical protein
MTVPSTNYCLKKQICYTSTDWLLRKGTYIYIYIYQGSDGRWHHGYTKLIPLWQSPPIQHLKTKFLVIMKNSFWIWLAPICFHHGNYLLLYHTWFCWTRISYYPILIFYWDIKWNNMAFFFIKYQSIVLVLLRSITTFTCWIPKKDDFEIRNSLSSVTQVWSGEYLSVIS